MGAGVVLVARSEDGLHSVAGEIRAAGGEALVVAGDVSQVEDCRRAVESTVEAYGRIDALVNNAGILGPVGPVAETEIDGWEQTWAVNVLGPVAMIQDALPYLRSHRGRVINISSGAAVGAVSGWGPYCLSKAAINMLTKMIAAEEQAVAAIALRPGVVDTAMQATIREEGGAGMPEDVHARFVRYHEQGELLPPEAPGCAAAVLAFHAPHEWSGEFLSWDDERVQSLVRRFACAQR
jgi:NAD(P)-dependent dehydrogenase (short-subunit alcohol dehydrogenase family)